MAIYRRMPTSLLFCRKAAWIFFFGAITFLDVTVSHSQSAPKVIPPSPNAAAFARYGDIPVSAYTGVPNISVPLYTVKEGGIEVPISLSYHASGIKVSDEASRVGLGWVLNAGGVISRNIAKLDDFEPSSFAYLSSSNTAPVIPNGPGYVPWLSYIESGTTFFLRNVATGSAESFDFYNYSFVNPEYDLQPDQFNYNFQGKSGKFVLTRNREAVIEKQDKLRIVPSSTGASWVVTDAAGTVYTFATTETVNVNNGTGDKISGWYLTKIKSVEGDSVMFSYTTLPQQFILPAGQFQEGKARYRFSCTEYTCTPIGDTLSGPLPRKNYSNVYLSSIAWKHGKAEFEVESREDLEGDIRIKQINISALDASNVAQLKEQYLFNYEYFDYNVWSNCFPIIDVTAERFRKRLKLVSVKRTAPGIPLGQDEVHSFQYYEEENLRLPDKNSFARDHWGYYNRKNSNISLLPSYQTLVGPTTINEINDALGEERNSSDSSMHAYSLKEIRYPTGGKTKFIYEAHQYEIIPGEGESEVFSVTTPFLYDAQANSGVVVSQAFDLRDQYSGDNQNHVVPIRVSGVFRANNPNSISTANVYFEIVDSTGNLIHRVSMYAPRCATANDEECLWCPPNQGSMGIFSFKGLVTVPPGFYYWRAFAETQATQFQDISVQYTWQADAIKRSPLGENVEYAIAGGLRIKQIETIAPESNSVPIVKTYVYNYSADTNDDGIPEMHSYGKRMRRPAYSYFEQSWERRNSQIAPIQINCNECYHLLMSADSYLPVTGSSGSSVTYDKVFELHGSNGQNGKVEFNFNNTIEQLINTVSGPINLRPSPTPTHREPLNGELISKIMYNAAGIPVSSVTNFHQIKFRNIQYGLEVRKIPQIGQIPTPAAVLMFLYPAVESSLVTQSTSIEKQYDANGNETLSKTTETFYDNAGHLQPTQVNTTFSDGQKTVTKYRYPADYSTADAGTVVNNMKGTSHIHNAPIESITLNEEASVRTVLDHAILVYDSYNGKILLKETAKLLGSSPMAEASLAIYKPVNGYSPTSYYKGFSVDYYPSGNIKKIQKNVDSQVAYLWGYKDAFPVAEIANATAEQCFYNSFEDTGSVFVDGTGNNIAKSGEKVLSSASYTFPGSYAPVAANTLMSYWYYHNSKWNFSGEVPYTATISTAGTKIDEVRAYPIGSKMTTYVYDPFRGTKQVFDPNGKDLKYEYDPFGRLKLEKDADGFIMKAYDYNYKITN